MLKALTEINNSIYFYSQVQPSSNNAAARSLAKDIQERNVRKVDVNAEITFVVWILECLANLAMAIVTLLVYGITSFLTLTMLVLWYHIILPYTHLMNTSHNKDRITDIGWQNTIRNAVGLSAKITPDSIEMSAPKFPENQPKFPKFPENQPSETRVVGLSSDNQGGSNQVVQAEVYTISKPDNTVQPSEPDYTFLPNVPEQQPSTSKGSSEITPRHQMTDFAQRSTSETDHDSIGLGKSYRLCIGKKIISNMMKNINNEEGYLHYFRQLVQFEETMKHEDTCHKDFEIVDLCQSKNTAHQMMSLKINLAETLLNRIDMRRNVLENWHVYCKDEELYDSFLNELLNFEESLVKD